MINAWEVPEAKRQETRREKRDRDGMVVSPSLLQFRHLQIVRHLQIELRDARTDFAMELMRANARTKLAMDSIVKPLAPSNCFSNSASSSSRVRGHDVSTTLQLHR